MSQLSFSITAHPRGTAIAIGVSTTGAGVATLGVALALHSLPGNTLLSGVAGRFVEVTVEVWAAVVTWSGAVRVEGLFAFLGLVLALAGGPSRWR